MAFDDTWYGAGTASVANGSTTVTGVGTNWLTAGIRQGDFFLAGGDIVPIASVAGQTGITLTDGWPGANRSGASYKIIPAVDGARVATAARDVLNTLTNGNLSSVAALQTLANKLAYYTGPGAAALTDLTAAGRALLALAGAPGAKVPVVTAAGTAALRDIVGTVGQSGGVPTGAIVERGSNANGEYVRFADGTQICQAELSVTFTSVAIGYVFRDTSALSWTFPASFAARPASFANPRSTNSIWATIVQSGNTGISGGAIWSAAAFTSTATTIAVMAIGRWI